MGLDHFRPTNKIPQRIYDAFQKQAELRESFDTIEKAFESEEQIVWEVARDIALENGIRVLTIDEIRECARLSSGHVDFGAKWAYAVERKLCYQDA